MTPPTSSLGRRTLLGGAATGLTVGASAATLDVAAGATPRADRVFAHGVASGDPRPRSVVLWTRVTPTTAATPGSGVGPRVTVRWEVASDARFRDVVRRGSATTGPGRDHTVKVDADGLRPGHWYWYRFTWDGVRSRVGRTRTAPADDARVDRLRVGVVSCSHYESGRFAAYRHLAERDDLDAVLHLGDYLYEYGPGEGVRAHVPDHEIVSTADYRQRHAQYKRDPDLQRLHARYPFVTTWDDHEVTNNAWREGAENHDPDQGEGEYADRKQRAQRVYDEWMPIRMSGSAETGDGTRLFRQLRWGRLADIDMLDLRSYRDEQLPTGSPTLLADAADPGRTLTGNRQLAWLKDRLSGSTARWKLVGNSVMIAPLTVAQLPRDAQAALAELTGVETADGMTINTDQWDGYTADRRELFDHISAEGIENTLFLTGDIHTAWASDLPLDPGTYPASGSAGVELVCASVTSDNFDEIMGTPPRTTSLALEASLQAANRHIRYVDLDRHGFSVLDVTPQRAQMDWWVLADKSRRDSPASCSASWATTSGSQQVHPVEGPVR